MNLSSYLFKRPNSQFWQLRRMVPVAARATIGRAELTKSLRTPNRREAEQLAFPILHEWDQQIKRAMGKEPVASTSPAFATLAAMQHHAYEQARATSLLPSSGIIDLEDRLTLGRSLRSQREAGKAALAKGDLSGWAEQVDEVLARAGLSIAKGSHAWNEYAAAFARSHVDHVSEQLAILDGAPDHFTPSTFTRNMAKRAVEQAKPGESIAELFEKYAAEKLATKLKRPDTIEQDRKVIAEFADFVGKTRSIKTISREEVRDWRNILASLPPTYKKLKVNAGMSAREAAANAIQLGLKPMSRTTVNKYLSTVSPLFRWCIENAYSDNNPCEGLFYDMKKAKKTRPPFSTDQLNTIVTSPLFVGFQEDGREYAPGPKKTRDWRFWLPLICIFTGARIGEIAQLRIDDIGEQDGIPFITIRHDESTGQSTKSGHDRPAPLHPTLLAIGFMDFVQKERQRAGGDGGRPLFAQLAPNKRGQISGVPSRFWRDYLVKIGIKVGADGLGAHAFRHTLADQLRTAGYLDSEIAVAIGHSQKSVTAGYGRLRQGTIARISRMIADVEFKDVSFEHLFQQQQGTQAHGDS